MLNFTGYFFVNKAVNNQNNTVLRGIISWISTCLLIIGFLGIYQRFLNLICRKYGNTSLKIAKADSNIINNIR